MSVQTTTTSATYTLVSTPGVLAAISFPIPFPFQAQSDIVATVVATGDANIGNYGVLRNGVDYTTTGQGSPSTPPGTLTLTSLGQGQVANNNQCNIVITRSTSLTQPTSLPSQGQFLSTALEGMVDRAVLQLQEATLASTSQAAAITSLQNTAAQLQTEITNITVPTVTTPTQLFPSAAALPSNTLTPDLSKGTEIHTVLDANLTVTAPTNNPGKGIRTRHTFVQDSTGFRSITWNAAWHGVTSTMPRQGPGQFSSFTFISNGDGTHTLVDASDCIDLTRPLNIVDFGAVDAVRSSGGDISAAYGAALTVAKALGAPYPKKIRISDGTWYINRPLIIDNNNLELTGDGQWTTRLLHGGTYSGPDVYVVPSSFTKPTIGTGPSGGTGSWAMDGTSNYCLNFNESPNICLNGLAQLCIELFVKLPDATNQGVIMACQGGLMNSSGTELDTHETLQVTKLTGDDGAGKAALAGYMNCGGTVVTCSDSITGKGVPLNTWTHVAWAYDGAHIRYFVNGVLNNTVSATGSIQSTLSEDFLLGFAPQTWGEGAPSGAMMTGTVGPIRVSKTARYTSAFTAPTSFSLDSNTILLHNFDQEADPHFSRCTIQVFNAGSPNGTYDTWLSMRRFDNAGNALGQITVSDLTFADSAQTGGGLYAVATDQLKVKNCNFTHGSRGVYLNNNCFESQVLDCTFSGGSLPSGRSGWGPTAGVFIGGACGVTEVRSPNIVGYAYQFVNINGGADLTGMAYFAPSSDSRRSVVCTYNASDVVFANTNIRLEGMVLDDENLLGQYLGFALLSQVMNVTIVGGDVDSSGNSSGTPLFTCYQVGAVNVFGTALGAWTSTPEIFHLLGTTNATHNQIRIFGSYRHKIIKPWCDVAGVCVVDSDPPVSVNHAASPYAWMRPYQVNADATAGTITVNLPAASAVGFGNEWVCKKTDSSANAVTVTPAGSDHIDGATSFALSAQYKFVRLVSDGTANWTVVGSN